MDSSILKSIMTTVIYYNEMDYPMTSFEIWKHMTNISHSDEKESASHFSFESIQGALDSESLKKYLDEYNGFYFLKGSKKIVDQRLFRNKISCRKLKRLRKIAWFLRFVPFIRMIGVTGRLAMKNADKNSDWDFFVIIKNGRIWIGRTMLTILIHLIGKRRHKDKIKDKVCLNYFITDKTMKIETENRNFAVNLFSANEYSFMLPLFGFKKFKKFQIMNKWIRKFKPNFSATEVKSDSIIPDTHFSKVIRKTIERIIGHDFVEKTLEKMEREKIARNPKTHLGGSIIEANDKHLVFLPEPQGEEIYENTVNKLKQVNQIR